MHPQRRYVRILATAAVAMLAGGPAAGTALAQAGPPRTEWTFASTFNGFVGAASDGSRAGLVGGGGIGWEVAPQLSIETTVAWFDRGRSAEAFAADFTALYALVPPRRVMPFVKAGAGVYYTRFDTVESPIPDFYQRRLRDRVFGATESFTDPAVVVGAGLRFWVNDRVAIRPELDAKAVMRESRAYWVSSASVRLAYYFVERPITDRFPQP